MATLNGHTVGKIGYGMMGLSWRATPCPTPQAVDACKTAIDAGANFWNGGDFYGTPEYNSLHVLKEYLTKYPEDESKIVLSIKSLAGKGGHGPDGSPQRVDECVEEFFKVLDGKKKVIDIFEPARIDKNTPIETTIEAIAKHVKAGRVGGIGLSECSAETIRRAAKVHKIVSVEVEYSLFEDTILSNGVASTCAELGIPIVAYSPLCRGFLTGHFQKFDDIPEDSMIRQYPRFSKENFPNNVKLLHGVQEIAKDLGATPGQIAIAWILKQSRRDGMPEIIPIPGATTNDRVKENLKQVDLDEKTFQRLNDLVKNTTIIGERYPDFIDQFSWG